MTLLERMMSKISPEPNSGCWLWLGGLDKDGYAHIWAGRTRHAHRVLYELMQGPIPPGLALDHLCKVRCCVNPKHLEPVTNWENVLRSSNNIVAINHRKTHCKYGHPFDEANTLPRNGGRHRRCKQCRRQEYNLSLARRRREQ